MEPCELSRPGQDPTAESGLNRHELEPSRIVTAEDFEAVDIEAPIRELGIADPHAMFAPYNQVIAAANEAGNAQAQRVYVLLRDICGMFLQPSSRAAPWVPMTTYNGIRSVIAEDFRGPQTGVLSSIVGQIVNAGLRARIAAIARSNNRRDGRSAVWSAPLGVDRIKPRF